MRNISEGLMVGDLNDLVLPLISIDEYESKLATSGNNTAVVIAFFVDDQDPAQDLCGFIQKTHVDIIDTDVSPAPSEDGYYLVFVEILRNKNVLEKIIKLVDSLSNLVNIEKWQFIPYGSEKVYDLTLENLKDHIDTNLPIQPAKTNEGLVKWFQHSFLQNVIVEENQIHFIGNNLNKKLNIKGWGHEDIVRVQCGLDVSKFKLDEHSKWQIRHLETALGTDYRIMIQGKDLIIAKANSNDILVVNGF
jgi:hypothetical protein